MVGEAKLNKVFDPGRSTIRNSFVINKINSERAHTKGRDNVCPSDPLSSRFPGGGSIHDPDRNHTEADDTDAS